MFSFSAARQLWQVLDGGYSWQASILCIPETAYRNTMVKTGKRLPYTTIQWFPPNGLLCSPASAVLPKSVHSLCSPPFDYEYILSFLRKFLSTFFAEIVNSLARDTDIF